MSEKIFNNLRIIHKHDTEENWLKAVNFIPKRGELIIYDKDNNYTYERMKIGDGYTRVSNLPFSNDWDSLENKPFGKLETNLFTITFTDSANAILNLTTEEINRYGYSFSTTGKLVNQFGVSANVNIDFIKFEAVNQFRYNITISCDVLKLEGVSSFYGSNEFTPLTLSEYDNSSYGNFPVAGDVWTIKIDNFFILKDTPIDEKYIPNTIARKEDIPEVRNDVLVYTEQNLAEEQQMQARKNQSLYYQESIYLGTIENVTFTDGLSQALEIPFLGINGNGNTGEANIQIDFISEDSKILRSFKGPYTWYNMSNIGVTVHEYTGISDNGFSLRLYNEEVLEYIPGSGQDNNLTTTLKFYQLNIKQVEEEFIPNAIARTKDVPELTSSFDNILNYNSFAADAKAVGEALNLKADISLVTDVESALYNAIVENDIEDKAYVDEKIDAIPQANWNQNDETASDYIQGRTHYKTNVYKNVLDIIPTEIERTTTLSSGKYRANLPVPSNSASNNYPNTNNILYCIVYNDVEYYRHAYSNNGNNYLGNMNIYNPALTDTGEPFYIMLEAYDAVYLYTRQAETFTIKIYEVEESTQYVQLDEKFIPDTIATKEYVDSNQTLKNIEEATRFVEKTKQTGFYFYLSNPLPNGWYYYEAEKYGNKQLNIVVVNKENTAVDKQVNINFPILFYLYSTEANIIVYTIQKHNVMIDYIYDIVNKTYDYYHNPSYNKAQVDNLLANKITTPNTAETGQFLTVKSIDENGKPTEWECIDSFDPTFVITVDSDNIADKTWQEVFEASQQNKIIILKDNLGSYYSYFGEGYDYSIFTKVSGDSISIIQLPDWSQTVSKQIIRLTNIESFNSHKQDKTIHITEEERENWNNSSNKIMIVKNMGDGTSSHTAYEIYEALHNGSVILFQEGDKIYQLDYAEIDPSLMAAFYNYSGGGVVGRIVINNNQIEYLTDILATEDYIDNSNPIIIVTRQEDDYTKATLNSYEIYDLRDEGKTLIFKDANMIYYLNCSEIDPISEATFISWQQECLYVKKISGNGNITEECIEFAKASEVVTQIADVEAALYNAIVENDIEDKAYADSIKNDLLNGAGAAYDTLKELGELIDENHDAITVLEQVATNKADKTEVEALKTQVTATSLILADAITGQKYEIQIQNGQLVSFPVEE